ncbi:WD40 repeat-like protein, partial [Rhizopogon vinicolor AM-OR11-026]
LYGHTHPVRSICLSPDERYLLSASADCSVRIWDLKINQQVGEPLLHDDEPLSLAISSDGRYIASDGIEKIIYLWSIEAALKKKYVMEGHSECIWSLACVGASCNVVSASNDGSIRQWRKYGEVVGKPRRSDGGGVWSIAVSPDETMVVSGNASGIVQLWKEGNTVRDPWEGHNAAVICLDWSPNAREVASSGLRDGTIRRWNPDTGRQIALPIKTGDDSVNTIKYSPQGDKFASAGTDKTIRVWSKDGKLLLEIKGHDDKVNSLCWSKDGAHIFSGSSDDTIRKWQSIDGKELVVLQGHTKAIKAFCLATDEGHLVSASADHSIRIWDLKANQQVGEPLLHDDELFALAISSDGRYIASGGLDKKIYLWSIE